MEHRTEIEELIERVKHNMQTLDNGCREIWNNETRTKMFAATIALQANGLQLEMWLTKEVQSDS